MKARDLAILVLLAACWGGSFLFMRVAAPVLGPIFLIDARVLIAAIALVFYALLLRHRPQILHKWKAYLFLGAVNAAIPFCLIAAAELRLNASLAAILNATTPLLTAVVARVWIKDPLTVKKMLGLFLGILGVGVLVGWNSNASGTAVWGSVLMSLGAAFFYGIGGVFSSRFFKGEQPLNLAIGQQVAAGLLLLPVALFFLPHQVPGTSVVFSVLVLAVISTSFGYLLYFQLIRNVGPVKTLSVTFLVPVFGVLFGFLFLHEPVSSSIVGGLILILLSVILVTNSTGAAKKKTAKLHETSKE